MRLAALFLLLLSLSLSLCLIPEINIAASAPVLNQEIAKNLGPMIVQQVVNHTMNQTFVEEMSFGVVHVNISLSNLTVTELDGRRVARLRLDRLGAPRPEAAAE